MLVHCTWVCAKHTACRNGGLNKLTKHVKRLNITHIALDWLKRFNCPVVFLEGLVREWTVPAASVWRCCTSVSLPGCGVGGGASHFALSVAPGAVCVCCRLESAAVTSTSVVSRLPSSATAVREVRGVRLHTLLLKLCRFLDRMRRMLSISSGRRGRLWGRGSTLTRKTEEHRDSLRANLALSSWKYISNISFVCLFLLPNIKSGFTCSPYKNDSGTEVWAFES